ncbi:MAG TPA: class I adenylate-forming enzyme family protein [Acidimicrobiales bacterium]|nr:class I adenylate-forming enzyme family protein [Acidimicrobiales bacterium]
MTADSPATAENPATADSPATADRGLAESGLAESGLAEVVRAAATRHGTTPLYVLPDGSHLDYRGLDTQSDALAAGLARRGIGPGHVVALLIPSGPAYAVAYSAAAKLGAVTAGVNERLSPPERAACLTVAQPRLVLGTDALLDGTGAATLDGVGEVVVVPDPTSEADPARVFAGMAAPGAAVPILEPDPDRPVAIVFTSGTTGLPKGAVFAARQLDAVSEADGGRRWGGGGRGMSSTSFAHLGYMTKLPQVLRGGGTTFVMARWSAGAALDMIERHRLTSIGGIPTQVALMLRHERFADSDVSSVRMVALGGGPSTPALVRETRRGFGAPVVVRYTCTEAGVGVGTTPDDPDEDAEETVGRARPGVTLTIRDEEGRSLPSGEIGEVCLASAATMTGYWRDPSATAEVFTHDGAVRTGDLGFLDDRGRLHLSGRAKEMYVRGGYNVFPLEVEAVLEEHPAVAHVAVVPRADPVMGEIGVAVVVPRRTGLPPTLDELRAHGRGRLAAHKLPEAVLVVDELPRTAMEKVDRRALAGLVAGSEPCGENEPPGGNQPSGGR